MSTQIINLRELTVILRAWTSAIFPLIFMGCAVKHNQESVDALGAQTIQLTSPAFAEGSTIPKQFTGDGRDISPKLQWSGGPAGTQSFALVCDDPDAPRRDAWVHWVIYNIPPDKVELEEGIGASGTFSTGMKQGKNDFGNIGYGGPAPPPGKPHRYFFRIFALDTLVALHEGATKGQLETAMKGHILGQGKLLGTYAR